MKQDGTTPLFAAAENGHQESITALLQGGAAVDAKLEVRDALLLMVARARSLAVSLLCSSFSRIHLKYTRICREQAVRSSDYWTVNKICCFTITS